MLSVNWTANGTQCFTFEDLGTTEKKFYEMSEKKQNALLQKALNESEQLGESVLDSFI